MTEYLYKIIVVGAPQGGKTSLLDRYINNNFNPNYKGTLGGL